MKFFQSLAKGTDFVIEHIVLILVIIMIINIWAAVLFRYVLHSSLFWSEELGRYLMIWFGYLGCAMAVRDNSHAKINFFVEIFPLKMQRIFSLISNFIISVFVILVFIKSIAYLGNLKGQVSSSLQIPMVIPYVSITVGMILMLVMNISNMFDLIASNSSDSQPASESRGE